MNIFVLSADPTFAAQMQCDKHVVKMVLESAQILSTISGGPYKSTHAHHPCVLWAGATQGNYDWLLEHAKALCAEYTHRYGRTHKCQAVIEGLTRPELPPGTTPFVQCAPEGYRAANPVEAYRAYYRGDKASFAKWTNRETPYWWREA